MGGNAGVAALLERAMETVALLRPVFRDRDRDALAHGVAAEVIDAEIAAGVGAEIGPVLAGIAEREVEVIGGRELFLRVQQPGELEIHRVARLDLAGQRLAVRVREDIADAARRDDLIRRLAVLFHADDVAARGQPGDRDDAVGVAADALRRERAEAQRAALRRAARDGDGAAGLRREAIARALAAGIKQHVMLGVQRALGVARNSGIEAVQDHIGLDLLCLDLPALADGHDEDACELRPRRGEEFARRGALPLRVGHRVVGHEHDRRARAVCRHLCHAGVEGVRRDGDDVALAALRTQHRIVRVRDGDLAVHEALDRLPVAENVQLEGLADLHRLPALRVDVQIDVADVMDVQAEIVHDGCLRISAVADMEVLGADILGPRGAPALEVPVGHALRMADAVEISRALIEPVGRTHRAVFRHGRGIGLLHRVDIGSRQLADGDLRALRRREGHLRELLAARGNVVVHIRGLADLRLAEGRALFRVRRDAHGHGVAHGEDAARCGRSPVRRRAGPDVPRFSVGAADRDGHRAVLAEDPAGVRRDPVNALELIHRALARLDRQPQRAVAVAVCVVALDPPVPGGEAQRRVSAVRRRLPREAVFAGLFAVAAAGEELQILHLRIVAAAERQRAERRGVGSHGDRDAVGLALPAVFDRDGQEVILPRLQRLGEKSPTASGGNTGAHAVACGGDRRLAVRGGRLDVSHAEVFAALIRDLRRPVIRHIGGEHRRQRQRVGVAVKVRRGERGQVAGTVLRLAAFLSAVTRSSGMMTGVAELFLISSAGI